MKYVSLLLLMASGTLLVAQTTAKPATSTTAKTATHTVTHTAVKSTLPPGVPPVKGLLKTAFSLRYQDVIVGSGPLAESNKLYKVAYTGWLAADGTKFDASADHPASPVYDNTMQVIKGDDGKPKTEAGQPIVFPQGFGRVIPGWDQGFEGMHIGGKRRLFVPYQLAYGAKGKPSNDPKHPGIPAKADLIFDIELVDVMDMPAPPAHPAPVSRPGSMPMGHPGALPMGHAPVGMTPAPAAAAGTTAATPVATPAKPAASATPATTAPATAAPAAAVPATPAQSK
ncbi:FKBP-type peptidyl-prolyl cis-trans isomerase [Telmatobacter bradus]|uniref:FKBP-type peptidyl-prolyl cis-trans isomerase n=1 Tax=Telmatobacter bradus TaxID=474953 RepID=UPI003B42B22A